MAAKVSWERDRVTSMYSDTVSETERRRRRQKTPDALTSRPCSSPSLLKILSLAPSWT